MYVCIYLYEEILAYCLRHDGEYAFSPAAAGPCALEAHGACHLLITVLCLQRLPNWPHMSQGQRPL